MKIVDEKDGKVNYIRIRIGQICMIESSTNEPIYYLCIQPVKQYNAVCLNTNELCYIEDGIPVYPFEDAVLTLS